MQQASYKGPWGTMTPLEWGPPKCHTYDTKNGCELQSRYVSQTFKCLHIYKSLHIGHNMLLFLYWSPALNKYCDLYSELTHPKCTHTAVNTHSHTHTHTSWTHTRSSGQLFILWRQGAVGGSVPCSNHWLFAAVFASSCIHTYSTVCKQQCAIWWQHMVLPAWGSVFHSTQGEDGLYAYQTNPIDSSSSARHSKHRESWTAENVLTLLCPFDTCSVGCLR